MKNILSQKLHTAALKNSKDSVSDPALHSPLRCLDNPQGEKKSYSWDHEGDAVHTTDAVDKNIKCKTSESLMSNVLGFFPKTTKKK